MANGLYGQVSPAANTPTLATTTAVPAGKVRTVSVGICNTGNAEAQVSFAVSTATVAGDLAVQHWKRYNRPIPASGEYERTQVVMAAGEHVWVKASATGVAFDVRGFEGDA